MAHDLHVNHVFPLEKRAGPKRRRVLQESLPPWGTVKAIRLQLLAVEGGQLCSYAEPLVVAQHRGRDGALQVVREEEPHAPRAILSSRKRRFSSIRSSGYRS